jgi:hypothetical protein
LTISVDIRRPNPFPKINRSEERPDPNARPGQNLALSNGKACEGLVNHIGL